MQITLFGIIWFSFAIFALYTKGFKFATIFTLVSMTLQCDNVIYISGVGIGPQLLSSIVFLFKLIINQHLIHFKLDYSVIFGGLGLIAVICLSSVLNLGFDFEVFIRIVQLVVYFLVFVFLKYIRIFNHKEIKKVLIGISYYLLIMAVIQTSIGVGILPKLQLFSLLFYNTINQTFFGGSNYFRICSTFMESSYFAIVLCALIIYFYLDEKKNKHNYIILVTALIELVLTFSSTAFGAIAVTFLIYLVLNFGHNIKRDGKILIFGIICFIFLFFTTDVIQTVIFDKLDFAHSASGSARKSWDMTAYDNFLSSKVIGIGYKQSRASSLVYSLLGELGILGLITYFAFVFGQIKYIFKRQSYLNTFSWMVLVAIICQLIAVPDLDMCSTWMVFYIFAIAAANKPKKYSNNMSCVNWRYYHANRYSYIKL